MSDWSRKILLAASLAFNVFIVGAAAGAGYMWYATDRPRIAAAQRGLRFAAENLSAQQRRIFHQMLVDARRNAAADIEAARAGRTELARLLVQDQMDRPAIDAELARIRNADIALRTRLEQAVVSFAETLSAAERQNLVEGLRRRGGMLRRVVPEKN
jgi:uncharacterized membrane protein